MRGIGAGSPAGTSVIWADRATAMDAPPYTRVNTLFQAGARLQRIFERYNWTFCFIGGVANFRWGTPRLTNDLDLTLLTGFGGESEYIAALSKRSRISASGQATRPRDLSRISARTVGRVSRRQPRGIRRAIDRVSFRTHHSFSA